MHAVALRKMRLFTLIDRRSSIRSMHKQWVQHRQLCVTVPAAAATAAAKTANNAQAIGPRQFFFFGEWEASVLRIKVRSKKSCTYFLWWEGCGFETTPQHVWLDLIQPSNIACYFYRGSRGSIGQVQVWGCEGGLDDSCPVQVWKMSYRIMLRWTSVARWTGPCSNREKRIKVLVGVYSYARTHWTCIGLNMYTSIHEYSFLN